MIVSVTERAIFRRCRRRWDYSSSNRRGLVRIGPSSKALELGSLIHKALGEWTLHASADPVSLFMTFADQRMQEIESAYSASVGAGPSDEELAPLLDIVKLGSSMVANYRDYYKTPMPPSMSFVSIEQQVEVPIPGTPHVLKASFDGLLQDDKGRIFVLERKTYSRTPSLDTLHRNDQFTAYAWAASQLGIGPVHGIAYDGLLKKAPTSRARKVYTLEDLFFRTTVRKPAEELEVFERNLVGEVTDMARDDLVLYPNVPWRGCDDCSFGDLCTAQSRGEPIDDLISLLYTKRDADNTGYVSASVGGIRTSDA